MFAFPSVALSFGFPAGFVPPMPLDTPSDEANTSSACPNLSKTARHLWLVCVFRSRLFQLFFFAETHLLALLTLLLSCVLPSRNFSNRSMVPKIILLLGFPDLVDHIASWISARLVALSELSEPSGRAHPEFSYIPLSQCKLQAVCCRERLHVTVSGKFASLSLARTSNCTKILYFEGVSKYCCMAARSLVAPSRVEFPPYHFHRPSGLP